MNGRVLAGDDVDEGDAGPHRGTVGLAVDAHPSGFRLDDEIVAGARGVEPEAGDGAPDERRIGMQECVRVDTAALEGAGEEVVDDRVGTSDQGEEEGAIRGICQVRRTAELVAVGGEVVGAFPAVIEGWSPSAGIVAGSGAFDLDDIGPQIAEGGGAVRPGEHPREVKNADSL